MTSVNCVICAGRYLEFPLCGYVRGTYETPCRDASLIATAGTEADRRRPRRRRSSRRRPRVRGALPALLPAHLARSCAACCTTRLAARTWPRRRSCRRCAACARRTPRSTSSRGSTRSPATRRSTRYRRNSHAVEVSMDADDGLRASDRTRLVGLDGGPDAALVTKERMTHLQGAFDELSDVHTRVLVMRELEGMSYREIGKQLDLTRPAVESALFRARRRLESEYTELSEGRRCEAMRQTMIARWRPASTRAPRSTAWHATRGAATTAAGARARWASSRSPRSARCARRRRRCCRSHGSSAAPATAARSQDCSPSGANAAPLAERAAALVAAAALVGAGGAALGSGALRGDRAAAGGTVARPSTPRQCKGNRSAAQPGRHGRGARGSAPGVRAEGRSGRGPRRRFR